MVRENSRSTSILCTLNIHRIGELKVKVTQPCDEHVAGVAIRLRLDELSEVSTISYVRFDYWCCIRDLSVSRNTTSDGDFWDAAGGIPSQDWTTLRHKRTAFKVAGNLTNGMNHIVDVKYM